MGKTLVIVESPAKAKTLGKYLGEKFEVRASVGHVMDLPEKTLGVDVQRNFEPTYQVIPGKGRVINDLKRAARDVEEIYLAPDPDREGEAIAWHVARVLGLEEHEVYRVLFNEITKAAVKQAMANPTRLNRSLYEAQQARRILDRLVGYQISPILWKTVAGGLSAGRVQSVAVRIICEREKEIQGYQKKEYWSVASKLAKPGAETFTAKLWTVDGKRVVTKPDEEAGKKDRYWIQTEDQAGDIAARLRQQQCRVLEVERKKKSRTPPAPFITSDMQRDAAMRFGWPAKKTMSVAQTLYEGVDLGAEGAVGLITYMRTDSTRLADTAVGEVRKFILATFGKEYLPGAANVYRNRKGNVQDAHEAIRPTSTSNTPEKVSSFLSKDQLKLYQLIWNRFVACQMKPAIYDQTTVDISAGESYVLRATGSVMLFPGFTAVYTEGTEENSRDGSANGDMSLPPLEKEDPLDLQEVTPRQHFTQPPPRFTESSLIRELERNGIGRPSTYASIMSTILDKKYVERLKGSLKPTELGFAVTDLLVEKFPGILNTAFTAKMESLLDEVEEGRQEWHSVLKDFYRDFKPALDNAMAERKKKAVGTEVDCDKCGAQMVIRWNRHGEQFLACSAFPACRNTKEFERDENGRIKIIDRQDKLTEVICDRCGKPMVMKRSRYGPFLACSGYPQCNNIKQPGLGVSCPEEGCDGELVEKRTRRGKIFYGCTRYPKCKFASWNRPVNIPCPNCGSKPTYEKTSAGRDSYYLCSACKHRFKDTDTGEKGGAATDSSLSPR